jgi:hypothetical protein
MLEHGLPIQHWTEGFTAYLSINGHINIIDNPYNNGLSIEGTVVPRLAGAALTKWNMTQRIAMIALKQRLGNEAKALIAAGTYTNCQSIMDKLNERFKPQGAGAFIDLCDALNNMTLSSYSNLTEYTAEFRRIDKDINALDSSLALPMPYMIQRYLQGLGPQFTPFRKTFNQINSVIPLSGVNSISFDQTVLKTELDIASQSQDEIQTAFYVKPTSKPAQEDYCCTDELRQRYQSAVGSLMYAMLGTRPDIAFAVSIVSRFASNPTGLHWKLVEDIFSYLHGHKDLQLTFQGGIEALVGFTDSDWGADLSTRRSTSGYVFNIGSGAISWSSKRQATIAMSTCEAEYVGQSNAIKEAIWLKRLLIEISASSFGPAATVIFCDNQGAIALAKNPQSHGRNKAIDMQHHFQREKVAKGDVKLEWIPTNKMVADGLTKALPKAEFVRFRSLLGVA